MKINSIAENRTELTLQNGDTVFFSYKTPVAAVVRGRVYVTEYKWSSTTSRHISKWLDGRSAEKKPQRFFDDLGQE